MPFTETRALLDAAISDKAFPAAAIDVGRVHGSLWAANFGRLTFEPDAAPVDAHTNFDLASLTKVIATTSLAMRSVGAGHLHLDMRLGEVLPGWQDARHQSIAVRHLLDHSSGLPGHVRLWERWTTRADIAAALLDTPLEQPPGTRSVYSDLGFITLGFLLEAVNGETLDAQFAAFADAAGFSLQFRPSVELHEQTAPTEVDAWRGRLVHGEVHDENAHVLGGVAGHAGLFGTARDVAAFARLVLGTFTGRTILGTPALMKTFATPTGVPGSSRALGWDTMRPTSSCGVLLSPTAIGHTGFTGTSLWIDWERDLYVVLLTNRVHPSRANEALVRLRPLVHDAVVRDVARASHRREM